MWLFFSIYYLKNSSGNSLLNLNLLLSSTHYNMQEEKLVWADNVRAIATVAVILLHVSAPLVPREGFNFDWWTGNLVQSLVRFCVPEFFMLTGLLLFDKQYELFSFLKKRFSRIIIPFLFWSFFYILFDIGLKIRHGEKLDLLSAIGFIINQYKTGSYYHLWFIYVMIGLYLITPMISGWIRACSNREILYFLVIWSVTLMLKYPIFFYFKTNIDLSYFTGYLGFMVLGYYLGRRIIINKKKKDLIAIGLFLYGILVSIFGTYFLFNGSGKLDELYYEYLTPNVSASAIGVFLFFKDKQLDNSFLKRIRNYISKYSYGIYLCHVLVLIALYKIGITCDFLNPLIGLPLTTILCISISCLLIAVIKKLPLGKYVSG
jgi:surface polysaccharide O-acyltransferase-like enzyme